MRTLLLTAVAGVALLSAAPAAAQEMAADDAPFSGVYIGAAGGYDVQPNDVGSTILFDRGQNGSFGDVVSTAAGANAFSPGFCNGRAVGATPGGGCRNDKDGWAYYGRIGADRQMGNIVVGIVAEFGKTEINDSVSAFSTTPASYTMYRQVNWEGSARLRLGFAADRTLFYGTGGPSYARIDHNFFTTNTANAFAQSGRRDQLGFTGGGGIEQMIGRNLSFGLEYMYHQYDDDRARVSVTRGTAAANNPFVLAPDTSGTDFRRSDPKFRWHSMRATVGFRF